MKRMLQSLVALSMLLQFVGSPIMAQEEEIIDDTAITEDLNDEILEEEPITNDEDEIIEEDIIDEEEVITEEVSQFNPYWKKESNGKWRYYINHYEYVKNTAYCCYDDYYYCFDAYGYMLTDYWYNPSDGIWYYYGSNGRECTGWNKIDNKWYYFIPYLGNRMAIATVFNIDGVDYNFSDSGALIEKGWYKWGGQWFYYDAINQPHNGWLKYNGDWYYLFSGYLVYDTCIDVGNNEIYCFDQTGRMVKNKWYKNGDGNWYYFGNNGKQVSGWNKINNKWYYFIPGNSNIMARSTCIDIKNFGYYFDDNGVWIEKGWFKFNGEWMYLDSFDTFHDGWLKSGNYWYYISDGWMVYEDWIKYNGIYYYLDEKGHMVTNQWVEDYGDWYYYGADGKEVRGWQKINNKWYYFNPDYYNAMAANCTLLLEDGYTYTFDSKGHWTKSVS